MNKVTNPGQYEGQSYLHSMTHNRTEKGMQVTLVARPDEIVGEEKKQNDWPDPLGQNDTFSSEEIWKRIFSFEDRSRRIKKSVYSQKLWEAP